MTKMSKLVHNVCLWGKKLNFHFWNSPFSGIAQWMLCWANVTFRGFRPSATKSGRPYGAMYVSLLSLWDPPPLPPPTGWPPSLSCNVMAGALGLHANEVYLLKMDIEFIEKYAGVKNEILFHFSCQKGTKLVTKFLCFARKKNLNFQFASDTLQI